MTRLRATALAILTTLGLSGCSLVIGDELDPLMVDPNTRRTVSLRLFDFGPHFDSGAQLVVAEFVRPDTNLVQASVRYDPLPSTCVDVTLPFGASVAATQVDFYADIADDGLMSPPDDHSWRRELDESGRLEFRHEFNFEDLLDNRPTGQGSDLVLDVTGADAIEGSSVVASLIQTIDLDPDGEEPELVDAVNAVYVSTIQGGNLGPRRGPMMDEPPRIRGVVDGGVTYVLELNVDGGSMRCRLETVADPTGDFVLSVDFSSFECDSEPPVDVFTDCSR